MMHKRKYTLIELLVVVAIIVILVAVLLSVMQVSKEKVKRITCRDNIKNLSSAMASYSADNNGLIICGRNEWGQTYNSNHRILERWATGPFLRYFGPYMGVQTSADNQDTFSNWMHKKELISCPSMMVKHEISGSSKAISTDYSYAGIMFPRKGGWVRDKGYTLKQTDGKNGVESIAQYEDPSQIMFFADLIMLRASGFQVNHGPAKVTEKGSVFQELFAEIKGTNVGYLDGSVKWKTTDTMGRQNTELTPEGRGSDRFHGSAIKYYW